MMKEATKDFIFHNPLHMSEFPAARQMEAEVVKMTCNLFNGPEASGFMTSGGTESILMGVYANKNHFCQKKGIKKPNAVLPITIHPAFMKACAYYGIEVISVETNKNKEADFKKMKSMINSNTIMIAGSCPQFPHGTIDNIPELAKIAEKYDIGMHVDCCLGSFVVPFCEELGEDIPVFDFRNSGVTSISCDHHKYGLAPKGVSCIMFKNADIQHCAYFCSVDWPGGLYATASPAGSRCSAPSVGAWFAMMYHGRPGYKSNAEKIISSVRKLRTEIDKIPELEILGKPQSCVIAFTFRKGIKGNIYAIDTILHKKGYILAALQFPPALHISLTLPFCENTDQFIKDLKLAVKEANGKPELHAKEGSAAIYASSNQVLDKKIMGDVLNFAIDASIQL